MPARLLIAAILSIPLFGQEAQPAVSASVEGDWLSGEKGCLHIELSTVWMDRELGRTRHREWMTQVVIFENRIAFSLVPGAGRPYEFEGTLSGDGQSLTGNWTPALGAPDHFVRSPHPGDCSPPIAELIAALVRQFCEQHDVAAKERILESIVMSHPVSETGRQLLDLAKTPVDTDTRWLAIRGLGRMKFSSAAPFLVESLESSEHYVPANAAHALGELRYSLAAPALIHLLEVEQDPGVIEQTSLALRMIHAVDAIPVLKSRMSFHSPQTRCWLLDAIAGLGSKSDVPFIAKYLYDTDSAGVSLCAARALAALTGEDFGLPRGSGLFDPQAPVLKARKWWEETQKLGGPH